MSEIGKVPVIRPSKAVQKTAFSFEAAVGSKAGPATRIEDVARAVMGWVAEKHPDELPGEAFEGQSFEARDNPVSQVQVVRHGDLWSLQLRQPDQSSSGLPPVAGRFWTTEVTLAPSEEGLRVGIWVTCSSRPETNPPLVYVRPRLCLDLALKFGLWAERELADRASVLQDRTDLDLLYRFLMSPLRTRAVVVISEHDQNPPLCPDELAERLHCLAHVIVLPGSLTAEWTGLVGQEWGVSGGAVRVYLPGLSIEDQAPSVHPIAPPEAISAWSRDGAAGPKEFGRHLYAFCIEQAAAAGRPQDSLPRFLSIKSDQTRQALSKLDIHEDLKAKIEFLEEVSELYGAQAEEANAGFRAVKERLDIVENENVGLRAELDQYRRADRKSRGALARPRPTAYSEIAAWCEEEFGRELVLHSRAVKALKSACYEDISVVIDTLALLAGPYRERELGLEGANTAFEEECRRLRLELGKSISDARIGEEGDTYYVRYPKGSEERRVLEWHLKRGVSFDKRRCFRCYFFFDKQRRLVVVGYLPDHLDTRAS